MNNVDKGFELQYAKLSHRRKFIRTIEITVIGVIILLILHDCFKSSENPAFIVFADNIIAFGLCAIMVIVGTIQGVIEYKKWIDEKKAQK